ncbi:MAG: hypothetical protein JNM40_08625 [Myxococcales bacterium]|nr:hypothetical protein [Myxococcales bacterium]
MSSVIGRSRESFVRCSSAWFSRWPTLCCVAALSLSVSLCCFRHAARTELDPLPPYTLSVQESHCAQDAVMIGQTLHLHTGAMLDVTLRPTFAVAGSVSVRTFVQQPQLPAIRHSLAGEAQPSSVGTFHLRARVDRLLPPGSARLLFVLSRPSHWLSLRPVSRQVLVLSVQIVRD